MGETEGVTKFHVDFRRAPPPDPERIAPLNAWRTVLHRLGLISQDPDRYGGVGFGNVSMRASAPEPDGSRPLFLVTGTQTGGLPELTERHYCWVLDYDLRTNSLTAAGPIAPSSEALTHAAVYDAEAAIHCVLHVHSPEIWNRAADLGLPIIATAIAYGTPEMARAVGAVVARRENPIIVMGGHQDGIIAYGGSIEDTAVALIRVLARALQ